MFLYYFLGAYTLCGKSGLKPDKSENNSNSRVYLAKLIQFVKFKNKKKELFIILKKKKKKSLPRLLTVSWQAQSLYSETHLIP